MSLKAMNIEYRFRQHFLIIENSHWIWKGSFSGGYGRFKIGKTGVLAHRVSMHLYRKFDLDSDLCILHKLECNTKACVNPEHLYIGTHAENMRDIKTLRTHCKHGHEFSEKNTYFNNGRRHCLTCKKLGRPNARKT